MFGQERDESGKSMIVDKERQSENGRWFCASSTVPRGVVMLVHGLNQNPSSWRDMLEYLNSIDLHVYRLALQGHRGLGFDDMKRVSDEGWKSEIHTAVEEITRYFPNTPRILMGFSLGCLLPLTVQLQDGKRYFDIQVLLAPALSVRPYTRLVLPLCRFISYLPSRAPSGYLANKEGISAEAYRTLFQLERDFRAFSDLRLLNIPTLILMRPGDELISYRSTVRLMERLRLTRWQMVHLVDESSLFQRLTTFKHLIVDKRSAGATIWNSMTTEINTFLSSRASAKGC